jgi:hypothetical protein
MVVCAEELADAEYAPCISHADFNKSSTCEVGNSENQY